MSNAEKLAKAIEWLGTRWVLHQQYVFNPKHSLVKR